MITKNYLIIGIIVVALLFVLSRIFENPFKSCYRTCMSDVRLIDPNLSLSNHCIFICNQPNR